jgi:hypothetical protein
MLRCRGVATPDTTKALICGSDSTAISAAMYTEDARHSLHLPPPNIAILYLWLCLGTNKILNPILVRWSSTNVSWVQVPRHRVLVLQKSKRLRKWTSTFGICQIKHVATCAHHVP